MPGKIGRLQNAALEGAEIGLRKGMEKLILRVLTTTAILLGALVLWSARHLLW